MASEPPRIRIPVKLVLIDVIGALVAGLGFWGLIDPGAAERVPFLESMPVAVLLLAIGAALMTYAVVGIMRRAMTRPRR